MIDKTIALDLFYGDLFKLAVAKKRNDAFRETRAVFSVLPRLNADNLAPDFL